MKVECGIYNETRCPCLRHLVAASVCLEYFQNSVHGLQLSQSIHRKQMGAHLHGKSGKLPFHIWHSSRRLRDLVPAQSDQASPSRFSYLSAFWKR